MDIAIVTLSTAGSGVARAIAAALPGAHLHGLAERVPGADVTFTDTAAHLRTLFSQGTPIVGVCAAGILIRALAPLLDDKRTEPPVIAVSADGASVVPLLGGHHGANRLTTVIAAALGGQAAITTAGDVTLGLAPDDPPKGWRVGNPEAAKPVAAALLAGQPVRLEVENGSAGWLTTPGLGDEGLLGIRVTAQAVDGDDELILHPPVLALGVGCERGTDPAELSALARDSLAEAGLSAASVACVVSLDLKADEPAVHALAAELGVAARFFTAAALEAERPRLIHPSNAVFAETGCHGVAEGAALAAAGPESRLIVDKRKSTRATCAIALAAGDIDAAGVGRPQGRLAIVGIGPGAADWRTPEASRAIATATDLVGYGLYLDLLGDAAVGKTRHDGTMGAEEARARQALDLAAEGRSVALVCSGDAGIYALATLVFELMDREDKAAWNHLAVSVAPGISALQAAAARAGAVINHDFCTISLSDLLTPWDAIRRRVTAAAEGDFVVAFYNPVSKRRRDQLPAAKTILLGHRPAETPVVIARNLGRDAESVTIVRLADLDAADVDMLSVVLVGNSETRLIRRGERSWVYTPRGYAKKWEGQ
ncbi:precorrin-3B C(17)-methyltransferase [Telmatospirillum sp.]|uniref:precorrin-3B C(17)-methyltransferase n=1 Tax=Telmatospirillum sp. TaxID=2079197 RepID=UPI002843B725|nr:precorrin-3B C(17)-methyltransferase [Telmatospirillum sp.]MDR3437562.1 precorrin-3B C(17)-methyltransferase [Telmatospirillum sp.]